MNLFFDLDQSFPCYAHDYCGVTIFVPLGLLLEALRYDVSFINPNAKCRNVHYVSLQKSHKFRANNLIFFIGKRRHQNNLAKEKEEKEKSRDRTGTR